MALNNLPLPITVVFIERVPWGGGAERVVLDIARNMDPLRFRPVIASLYQGGLPPKHLARGLKFISLEPKNIWNILHTLIRGSLCSDPSLLRYLIAGSVRHHIRQLSRCAPLPVRQFAHCALHRLQAHCDNIRHFIRLRTRIRKCAMAFPVGKLQPFLAERLCRLFDIAYSKENIIISLSADQTAAPSGSAPPPSPRQPYLAVRPINLVLQARLIASYIASLRGPVVIIASMEEAASAVCLGLGSRPNCAKPFIIQTHAWESYYLPVMYPSPPFNQHEEHEFFAKALDGAEIVTSPSQGCAKDLVDTFGSPPGRTLCLPNPVDLEGIKRAAQAAQERPLPECCGKKPLLLCVGRLDPQKNHLLLFEACSLLREQGLDFNLVCLGDGHIRAKLEQRVRELNLAQCVHLFGPVSNPFPYMAQARAHITASDWESFGLVMVESLACGCLPISLDCPHGPRDVLDGGRAGILVQTATAAALAEAMRQALTDEPLVREKLSHGQKWIERYDIHNIVPQWEILISHTASEYSQQY